MIALEQSLRSKMIDFGLDYNRAIIEWEMERNGETFSLDDVHPGSTEWNKVYSYLSRYTKFNNMLRYNSVMVPAYLDCPINKDKRISWDPFIEHLPHYYKNRTADLYEERRIEKQQRELIIN